VYKVLPGLEHADVHSVAIGALHHGTIHLLNEGHTSHVAKAEAYVSGGLVEGKDHLKLTLVGIGVEAVDAATGGTGRVTYRATVAEVKIVYHITRRGLFGTTSEFGATLGTLAGFFDQHEVAATLAFLATGTPVEARVVALGCRLPLAWVGLNLGANGVVEGPDGSFCVVLAARVIDRLHFVGIVELVVTLCLVVFAGCLGIEVCDTGKEKENAEDQGSSCFHFAWIGFNAYS